MIAKVWKKVLLAVCIVACIYNVMHKLVSRTSLDIQLKSVGGQTSLTDSGYEEKTSEIEESRKNQSEEEERNQERDDEEETIVVIN